MIIVCTKQNIWTSQPCLHTLKETSLSANQRVHTSYFINNYSSTAILFVHYNLLLMLCLFLKKINKVLEGKVYQTLLLFPLSTTTVKLKTFLQPLYLFDILLLRMLCISNH